MTGGLSGIGILSIVQDIYDDSVGRTGSPACSRVLETIGSGRPSSGSGSGGTLEMPLKTLTKM